MPKGPPQSVRRAETAGLPPRLAEELEAAGGLWWASDDYTHGDEVIAHVRDTGTRATPARRSRPVAVRIEWREALNS